MIVGFAVANTGVNLVMVAVGYMHGRTAPILDEAVPVTEATARIIDPVPQALVLTAIVIGVGVTALMLAYAYRLFKTRGTLDIARYTDLKW
jgi:multisubunit Na+/H+ antiporter MnhC subunit